MKRLISLISVLLVLLGLSYSSWLMDNAHIVSPKYRALIEGLILEIERKTGCEIAIITENSLPPDASLEERTVELFERYGIGKKGKDNGLLIYVALRDRKVRIEVGYGLEPIITDGIAGSIIDKAIKPYFRKQEYGAGLYMALNMVADRLAAAYNVKITRNKAYYQMKKEQGRGSILSLLLFLFLFFMLFFGGGGLGWLPFFIFFGGGPRGGLGGGFGGGFGGFGGGMSGGGGASGSW